MNYSVMQRYLFKIHAARLETQQAAYAKQQRLAHQLRAFEEFRKLKQLKIDQLYLSLIIHKAPSYVVPYAQKIRLSRFLIQHTMDGCADCSETFDVLTKIGIADQADSDS